MQIPPIGILGTVMISLIILGSLFAIALVPAREFSRSARWHELRVRCQRLRRERLMNLLEDADLEDATPGASDIAAIGAATRQNAGEGEDSAAQGSETGVAGRIGGAAPAQARAA